jgi:hypothetical protein
MAASPNVVSFMAPRVFTKDEATAAERTLLFFLTNSADGSVATGKTIATSDFRISKNGAAFANAAGTVTEISLGWYKMVFAAADLDTAGDLACELSGEAGVDPIHCLHRVEVAHIVEGDIATDAINAASVKADAVTKIQSGLASASDVAAVAHKVRNTTHALGTLAADGASSGVSMKDASKARVTVTGTWGSGTAVVQGCADPTAAVPAWVTVTTVPTSLTANGAMVVEGPINAIRVSLSGSSAPSLVCTAEVSRPI